MLHKIPASQKRGNALIQILYPGEALPTGNDTGLGAIGRIDHAHIPAGTTIKMHPHVNDDILSYFRVGRAQHRDSAGITEEIGGQKLMLMKAGKVFYHEEEMLEDLEGLQIFLRPKEADTTPEVLFQELAERNSLGAWRLLAGPVAGIPFALSSAVWVYDLTLEGAYDFGLPLAPQPGLTALLYVFEGSIQFGEGETLTKGESVIIKEETPIFRAVNRAQLVLFLTDENAPSFAGGAFSGNGLS